MSNYVNVGLEDDDIFDPGRSKTKLNVNKQVFNPNNYLNTRLGVNESSRSLNIRIILTPDIDGRNKVAIPTDVHNIVLNTKQQKAKVIATNKFKSFLCLNDDHLKDENELNVVHKCPFCEKKKELLAEANQIIINENDDDVTRAVKNSKKNAILKEAFSHGSKIAYVVRCIERGKEEEGVKFWRFNKHDDGKGLFDILYGFYQKYKERGINLFDYDNGYDIIVTLTKDNNGKTAITLMPDVLPSPLSTDENQKNLWLNDDKDWRDMYRAKSYDYLKIVSDGESPVWDKDKNCYVIWKDIDELQREENELYQKAANELKSEPVISNTILINNDDNDGLPF